MSRRTSGRDVASEQKEQNKDVVEKVLSLFYVIHVGLEVFVKTFLGHVSSVKIAELSILPRFQVRV